MSSTILVVDDQRGARRVLASRLENAGFEVIQAADGLAAWEEFQRREPQLVITDLAMPHSDGIDLVGRIRDCSDVPVIVFSAYGSVPVAVSAVKAGADEFISSSELDVDKLVHLARELCETAGRRGSEPSRLVELLPGQSEAITRVRERLAALAPLRTPVLLLGEPGTGRTTAARALHDLGPTAGLDLYKVEAARFTPSSSPPREGLALLRGIEQLSPGGQSFWATHVSGMNDGKPLRIIASSTLSLSDWRGGRDLLPALAEPLLRFSVELPSLRERKEDIPVLAMALLTRIGARLGRERLHLSEDGAERVSARDWPGNLSQLKLVLEKAAAFAGRRELTADLLGPLLDEGDESLGGVRRERGEQTRDELMLALRDAGGNVSRAAQRLGLSRQAVYRMMEKLEISH